MNISKENLIQILKMIPGNTIAYSVKNDHFDLVYYSNDIYKLSGYSLEELQQSDDLLEQVIEEDRVVIRKKMKEVIIHNHEEEIELLFRLIHKDKGFVWIHLYGKKMCEVNGAPIFVANIVDVTKEMLSSYDLMEASNRSICVIEKATKRFLYANKTFYDLIDMTPAETMGKYCYEILCKTFEMRNNDNCLCYSSLNAQKPIETYNPEKGSYITISGREIMWGEYEAYVFYLTDITEEKKKDAMLVDSNKRFNVALENSDLIIWEYDMVENRCINSEKGMRDYNIPKVIDNYPESIYDSPKIPKETIEQIKSCKKRLEQGESGFSVERKLIDKDGKSRCLKIEYSLEYNIDHKPVRAIICGMDITEQKILEQKYKEQMELLSHLNGTYIGNCHINITNDCVEQGFGENKVGILDGEVSIIEFIQRAKKYIPDELEQIMYEKTFNRKSLMENFRNGQNRISYEHRANFDNDTVRWYRSTVVMLQNPINGDIDGYNYAIDIHEDKIRKILTEEYLYANSDLVVCIDMDHNSHIVFEKAKISCPIYRQNSQESILAYIVKNCLNDEHEFLKKKIEPENVLKHLEKGESYTFFYMTRQKDGMHYKQVNYAYLDKRFHLVSLIVSDITDIHKQQENHQQELEHALLVAEEANMAKTDFFSRMSHDMRTPMNGILGMAELSADEKDPIKLKENIQKIRNSGEYLLGLINDTLDFQRIESGKFQLKQTIVKYNELINEVIEIVKPSMEKKHIDFQIDKEDIDLNCNIQTDPLRFQQIFINLLSNAVKFTPDRGTVSVKIQCLQKKGMFLKERFIIQDTGIGMSHEFMKNKLFTPFCQERNEVTGVYAGSGLGLSIVKSLVELMGGTITVESEPEVGSTFIVTLDIERVETEEVEEKVTLEKEKQNFIQDRLAGTNILLVEDHPLNAEIAKRLLEKVKCSIKWVKDGLEGVKAFEQSKPYEYDVILMDIRMPIMNGLEAAQIIRGLEREDSESIPIIAMTANAYDDDIKKSMNAGMNEHLSKPINPKDVYEAIARLTKKE